MGDSSSLLKGVFACQDGRDGSEGFGENLQLFQLRLTMPTQQQVLFDGLGGRLGQLLQVVLF